MSGQLLLRERWTTRPSDISSSGKKRRNVPCTGEQDATDYGRYRDGEKFMGEHDADSDHKTVAVPKEIIPVRDKDLREQAEEYHRLRLERDS